MAPIFLSLLIWWVAIIGTLIMQRISQAWKAYAIYAAINNSNTVHFIFSLVLCDFFSIIGHCETNSHQ